MLLDFGFARHARLPDLLAEEGARSRPARRPTFCRNSCSREPLGSAQRRLRARCAAVRTGDRRAVRRRPRGRTYAGMRDRLWTIACRYAVTCWDGLSPPGCRRSSCTASRMNAAEPLPVSRPLSRSTCAHPDQVQLTRPPEKLERDPWSARIRRRFNPEVRPTRAPRDRASEGRHAHRDGGRRPRRRRGAPRGAARDGPAPHRDRPGRALRDPERPQAAPHRDRHDAGRGGPQQARGAPRRAQALGPAPRDRRDAPHVPRPRGEGPRRGHPRVRRSEPRRPRRDRRADGFRDAARFSGASPPRSPRRPTAPSRSSARRAGPEPPASAMDGPDPF